MRVVGILADEGWAQTHGTGSRLEQNAQKLVRALKPAEVSRVMSPHCDRLQ